MKQPTQKRTKTRKPIHLTKEVEAEWTSATYCVVAAWWPSGTLVGPHMDNNTGSNIKPWLRPNKIVARNARITEPRKAFFAKLIGNTANRVVKPPWIMEAPWKVTTKQQGIACQISNVLFSASRKKGCSFNLPMVSRVSLTLSSLDLSGEVS